MFPFVPVKVEINCFVFKSNIAIIADFEIIANLF